MTGSAQYTLEKPDPSADASFAFAWFDTPDGPETLRLMGNGDGDAPTLEAERERLEEFLTLEADKKRLTWMIHADGKTIGAAWIDLVPTDDLDAPAVYLMIGDVAYRHKGIGSAVIKDMTSYAYRNLPSQKLYSRYVVTNDAIAKLLKKAGFEKEDDAYEDEHGQKWQNVSLVL